MVKSAKDLRSENFAALEKEKTRHMIMAIMTFLACIGFVISASFDAFVIAIPCFIAGLIFYFTTVEFRRKIEKLNSGRAILSQLKN